MKTTFGLAFVLLALNSLAATPPAEIPPDAVKLQRKLSAQIAPAIRDWVTWQAVQTRARPDASADVVRAAVKQRFAGQNLTDTDSESLVFLVLFEITQAEDKDLRDQMTQVEEENRRKQQRREQTTQIPGKAQPIRAHHDSLDAPDQMSNMRLQLALDRRSKALSALSSLLEKTSATASNITQNLK